MSLEAIELLSETDRQAYADFLALELMKPEIRRAPHPYPTVLRRSQGNVKRG